MLQSINKQNEKCLAISIWRLCCLLLIKAIFIEKEFLFRLFERREGKKKTVNKLACSTNIMNRIDWRICAQHLRHFRLCYQPIYVINKFNFQNLSLVKVNKMIFALLLHSFLMLLNIFIELCSIFPLINRNLLFSFHFISYHNIECD